MKMTQKRVLLVGLACVDIINVLGHYPEEDTDSRCTEQYWFRGGNSGSTSVVLAQLGITAEYYGTIAKHKLSELITDDLHRHGVITQNCVYHENCKVPTSCCIVNAVNGSRTIIHANINLPELRYEDFLKLDLSNYMWIHFEGINVKEVLKMITKVEEYNSKMDVESDRIIVSVELEKPKEGIHDLLIHGDIVFISKDYAQHFEFFTAETALQGMQLKRKKGAVLVCAWGELGACAMEATSSYIFQSPAFPPDKVLDTLGAGDTFNAGVIYSLSKHQSLKEAITLGCKLAGKKCGQHGFDGIADGII